MYTGIERKSRIPKGLRPFLCLFFVFHFSFFSFHSASAQFLQEGDTIAIISPSSATDTATINGGIRTLERWGFHTVVGHHALKDYRGFAGTITGFAPLEAIKGMYSGKNGAGMMISLSRVAESAFTTEISAGAAPQVRKISLALTSKEKRADRSAATASLASRKPAAMEYPCTFMESFSLRIVRMESLTAGGEGMLGFPSEKSYTFSEPTIFACESP